MNKTYVIQWKSRVNGRTGRGTKLFDREEADRLVEELNREYPQIEHEILNSIHVRPVAQTASDAAEPENTESTRPMQALAA